MAATNAKNSLGIYISPKEICIAQVRVGKGKPEPEHIAKFPTGFAVKEGMLRPLSLNNEFFSEKASWLTPFGQAMKQINWGSSSAMISLSPQFGILRYFVMPCVDRKFWSKSIPLESKKYIPVSFDEVVYDYDVEAIDGGKKLGVLFGLTQRKSIEFIINTLKANGLELSGVELSAASLERLFGYIDAKDHNTKGYIHFHAGSAYMMFSHSGAPVLYRESEAEGSMSGKRLDIKGGVQFVDRYVGAGAKYQDIRLSGEGADTWKPIAEKEAETIPVSVWDPAALCSLKDPAPAGLFALGAAIRDKVALKPRLDISGLSAAARLEKEVQVSIWMLTALLGGILLVAIIFGQVRLLGVNSKLSALESQVSAVPELANSNGDEIRMKIDAARAGTQLLEKATGNIDPLAPKLAAIVDNIPSDVWLAGIKFTAPLQIGEKPADNRELTLMGETFLTGERKTYAAEAFRKALRAAPEFKSYTEPRGTLEFTIPSAVADTTVVGPFLIVGRGRGVNN